MGRAVKPLITVISILCFTICFIPKQQDIMCNLCFLPSTGISARIFAKWLELPTLNEINDLIETGFVQTTTRHTISLHPMIQRKLPFQEQNHL